MNSKTIVGVEVKKMKHSHSESEKLIVKKRKLSVLDTFS